jgi:hypothetical protein
MVRLPLLLETAVAEVVLGHQEEVLLEPELVGLMVVVVVVLVGQPHLAGLGVELLFALFGPVVLGLFRQLERGTNNETIHTN